MAKVKLPPYKNAKLPIERRVKDLLARMTIEEKTDQLIQIPVGMDGNPNNQGVGKFRPTVGSVLAFWRGAVERNKLQRRAMEESRLGIPIIWGFDVIHGMWTNFPIPLAQACSFNPELARLANRVAAQEAVHDGVNWSFAPMVDLVLDPRWGRVAESFGESPYVSGVFAAASVRGFQGDKFDPHSSVVACLKHFVGYGFSEGGRDYSYSDISMRTLWEACLPSFKAGVDAGAMTLMSSFNDITGTPAVCNRYTLTEVLRKRWGFEGFVVSDWAGVEQLAAQGYSKDPQKQTIDSLSAGNDMDMADNVFTTIPALVKAGKLDIKVVDEAVRRVLRIKFRIGLFETPYCPERERTEVTLRPEYLQLARRCAEETLVLLKNRKNTLPLKKSVKSIALIGPVAKDRGCMRGMWAGIGGDAINLTIEEGLAAELPQGCAINYAAGCDFESDSRKGFAKAVAAAKKSEAIVLCMGEPMKGTGEDESRANICLHGAQEALIAEMAKLGKPLILLLSTGRPLDLHRVEPLVDAVLYVWQPGCQGALAIADVLTGKVNPSGRLAITFPRTAGHIPTYHWEHNRARNTGNYKDMPTEPLYPFGYGLSYTNYAYSDLSLSTKKLGAKQKLTAKVKVRNTGKRAGMETIFWYISDVEASLTQPGKRLIGFEKIGLAAGEEKTVTLTIEPLRDLSYPDSDGKRILEPGKFVLTCGTALQAEFVLA